MIHAIQPISPFIGGFKLPLSERCYRSPRNDGFSIIMCFLVFKILKIDVAIQIIAKVGKFLFDLGHVKSVRQWFVGVRNALHFEQNGPSPGRQFVRGFHRIDVQSILGQYFRHLVDDSRIVGSLQGQLSLVADSIRGRRGKGNVALSFSLVRQTLADKSGICCRLVFRASTSVEGTSTSIIREKYCPSLAACEAPTFPPASMTSLVMSWTIPRRSVPTALMTNCVCLLVEK